MPRMKPVIMVLAICLGLLISGCGSSAPEPSPTSPPPTDTRVPPSQTTEPTPSDTPEPTATDTLEPTATATETPTETPNLAATAAFESTQIAQEALARVADVLPDYGLSPDSGSLGWIGNDPMELDVQNFGTIIYEGVADVQEFDDFVLHVDVTWDSTSGLAGCGVIFRSEPDLRDGEQYMLRTLRLSGLPAWRVEHWDFGAIQNVLRTEPNAAIRIGSGEVNKFVMVLKGTTMTLYANGIRLTGLTINQRRTGRIAFLAWQDSGITSCLYENAWIWELED